MKSVPVRFVNAFANGLFDGNTAAVVLLDAYPEDAQLLQIARLFGFSETAFLVPSSSADYHIRWFTPETEVSLCGHASLASAKVIFEHLHPVKDTIRFASLSGELIIRRVGEMIELNFPLDDPISYSPPPEVLRAVASTPPKACLLAPGTLNLLLVYDTAEQITALSPDFASLTPMSGLPFYGIAVTAATGADSYICRYFAPWEGINEDPVTGSAQTFIAPYWASVLGVTELNGHQASARGGRFTVKLLKERVLISGKAVIYLQGSIELPD